MSSTERIDLSQYAREFMAKFGKELEFNTSKIILGGNTGAGKSVLAMTFPKIHLIALDDSWRSSLNHAKRWGFTPDLVKVDYAREHVMGNEVNRLMIYQIMKQKIKDAMSFSGSETVIIDSLSTLYDLIMHAATFENKTTKSGKEDGYAKWNFLIEQLLEIFGWQALSPKNIIILIHWEKDKGPDGLERWYPKLPTKLQFDFGKEYQNMWNIYIGANTYPSGNLERYLQTMPSASFDILKSFEPQNGDIKLPEDPSLIYPLLVERKLVLPLKDLVV